MRILRMGETDSRRYPAVMDVSPPDAGLPVDSPRALKAAPWVELAPKVGLGSWILLLLVAAALHSPGLAMFGVIFLLLGSLIGVAGGGFVLARTRSKAARKSGKTGLWWGGIILAVVVGFGGCSWAVLEQFRREVINNYDRMQARDLALAASNRLKAGKAVDAAGMVAQGEIPPVWFISWHNLRTEEESRRVTLRTSDFILVPGIQSPPRSDAIAVFVDPAISYYREQGEVPAAFENGDVRMLPLAALETKIKAQTGLGSAEIVRRQREEK